MLPLLNKNVLFSFLLLIPFRIFFQTHIVVSVLRLCCYKMFNFCFAVSHVIGALTTLTFTRSRKQKFLPESLVPASVMRKPIDSRFKSLMMIGLFSWGISKSGTERCWIFVIFDSVGSFPDGSNNVALVMTPPPLTPLQTSPRLLLKDGFLITFLQVTQLIQTIAALPVWVTQSDSSSCLDKWGSLLGRNGGGCLALAS